MQKSLRTPRQILLQSLLVEARKAKGLTQADLADALGKPQSFVAKYENGERRIDVVEFVDITAVLGIATSDLLTKIEPAVAKTRPAAR
ncbi:helix-turn-helix domain-containing protein [Novosphingobium capsulatum]|uniref:helix-turn-helix domain-containing protein n=1 Tax=Novosphingobium capsulatum TaxID=13688 RepID=UPI000786FD4A|nr:helix-turn-helix transcriptional regulator [Novosphingobium capsulatum]WQD94660.1 helix-turn-helix transcriptional regulator [Novosphingobium capsulatum]